GGTHEQPFVLVKVWLSTRSQQVFIFLGICQCFSFDPKIVCDFSELSTNTFVQRRALHIQIEKQIAVQKV
ncbi:AGAP009476-PA, partial [Anopheles gambiae str. PEST]